MVTTDREIEIKLAGLSLPGFLSVPEGAKGLVIFVHGSGSGRFSPRNQLVARILQDAGFATLLFDLLTEEEDEIYENRFDIDLITRRLIAVTQWAQEQSEIKNLALGYFGASTGTPAALKAAAKLPDQIKAIVSRGGRPDLAAAILAKVKSPTMLIVGGDDFGVIELNQAAFGALTCEKKLEIVPGATHLFEEPGKLEEVARLAVEWFEQYLK